MKLPHRTRYCLALAACCLAFSTARAEAEPYQGSCRLGDARQGSSIEMRQDPESRVLTLVVDGRTMPAFGDLDAADYEVGEIVASHCSKDLFVFVFNYGSPYLKGFVYRKCGPRLSRLDFAEKLPPIAVSRCPEALFAVFPDTETEAFKIVDARHTRRVARINRARLWSLPDSRQP